MIRRSRRSVALAVLVSSLLLASAPARADEYDPEGAGHPLRIVAYVLHPVGYLLDRLIFRPAHWLVHRGPLKEVFGHED